jgi:hypothetical protein
MLSRLSRFAVPGILAASLALAVPCHAQDGILGIYFDRDARACSGDVPTASYATLYVVLQPAGATYGGITGVEFRIDTSGASGFMFMSEANEPDITARIGSALGGGANLNFASCHSGSSVSLMSFQVLNAGSGRDGVVRVSAHSTPHNSNFPCVVAVECDDPVYTTTCVEGGIARLNPGSPVPCGSSRVDSEWTRVKGLFR